MVCQNAGFIEFGAQQNIEQANQKEHPQIKINDQKELATSSAGVDGVERKRKNYFKSEIKETAKNDIKGPVLGSSGGLSQAILDFSQAFTMLSRLFSIISVISSVSTYFASTSVQERTHTTSSDGEINFIDIKQDKDAPKDLGGHGGTVKGNYNGKPVFGKPMDPVEYLNYQTIRDHASDLADYFPGIEGRTKRNDGKEFMVMENLRMDENGNEVIQLADIKIAGHVEGLDNPIYDPGETRHTRGKVKNRANAWQMEYGAKSSPGYMIAEDSKFFGKAGRLRNYARSEELLKRSLSNHSKEQINGLIDDLKKIKKAMKKSPIAFIGASIIFLKNTEGKLIPKLIDPAHIQVDPRRTDIKDTRLYRGDHDKYKLQKQSNEVGIQALIDALVSISSDKK